MPGFITHSLFARDVFFALRIDGIKAEIEKRMPLYYLGAQGPDIFFYYKAKPWIKYDGVERLGFIMHDCKTADFFVETLDYIKNLKKHDTEKQLELSVYIAGYLCHFALDLTAHPYIHYTAGVNSKENRSTFRYHIYHKQLESIIDTYMLKIKDGKQAYRFRDFELIENVEKYQEVLEDFYIFIVEKLYGIRLSHMQLKNLIGDISHILKVLYDPWNFKIWFFRLFENIYGRHGEITSSMHPRRVDTKIDYLNQNENIWTHPCRSDIKSSKSFLELYDEALLLACKLIRDSKRYLEDETSDISVKSFIKDTSYATGLDCGTEKDLRYFDSIFENPRFIRYKK